jgi:sugar O-acyltransferase (sialic acid O-acetyltransferase NeuD family)
VAMILELLYSNNFDGSIKIIKNIDSVSNLDYKINSYDLLESYYDAHIFNTDDVFILGAFRTSAKLQIYDFFNNLYNNELEKCCFKNIISPKSYISSSTKMGKGVIVSHNCTLDSFVIVGDFVTINRNSSIGHHTKLGNFVTLNPNCHIAGNCDIGNNVQICMSTTIIDDIKIGNNSIIGANSFVNKNVPDNVLVYGSPAKIIKYLEKKI